MLRKKGKNIDNCENYYKEKIMKKRNKKFLMMKFTYV